MKEVKLTRQELYDLVWGESMLQLAKRFIISDVGLRKKCRSLEIPLPNAGYWAKVKYGKKVTEKRPLRDFNGEQTALLKLREDENENALSHAGMKKMIESDNRINLIVPEKLSNPDKMILSVKEQLKQKEVLKEHRLFIHSPQNELSITVRPVTLPRVLCFMDTLIKAMRGRGFEIKLSRESSFFVFEREEYAFWCHENLTEVTKVPGTIQNKDKYISTLCLHVKFQWSSREWQDGKRILEQQLSSIIATLEVRGKRETEERIIRENHWAELRRKEQIEKNIQDRKEKELNDFKELFKKAIRHDKAEMIRSYADKLEKHAIFNNELTAEKKEEIDWARKKADWYDPFIEADDELLSDVEKEELIFKKKNWRG
jgi:hypothetical protein